MDWGYLLIADASLLILATSIITYYFFKDFFKK